VPKYYTYSYTYCFVSSCAAGPIAILLKKNLLGVRIIAILAHQSVEYDRLEHWIYAYVVEVHTSWNDTFWARQSVLCLQLFALLTYHHTSSAG